MQLADSDLSLLPFFLELHSYPFLAYFLNLHYFFISLYDTLAYWVSTTTTFSELSQNILNYTSKEAFNVHIFKIYNVCPVLRLHRH